MVSKTVAVVNPMGFHMRPASLFAQAMGKYKSEVKISYNGNEFDAKSVMNLMAACMKQGAVLELRCSGPDEADALQEAEALIASGLGEG